MSTLPRVTDTQVCPPRVASLIYNAPLDLSNGRGAFQWWEFECGSKALVVYPKGSTYEQVRDIMDSSTDCEEALYPYTVVLQTADHSNVHTIYVEGIDKDEAIECAVREAETHNGETFDQVGCDILAVFAGHHSNLESF